MERYTESIKSARSCSDELSNTTNATFLEELREHQFTSRENIEAKRASAELDEALELSLLGALERLSAKVAQQDLHLWEAITGVFQKIGNETHIGADRFDRLFGQKSGDLLRKIGVQTIDIKTGRRGEKTFELAFTAAGEHLVGNAHIKHDKQVRFEYRATADSINLTKIKGLEVQKLGSKFTATIDEVSLTQQLNKDIIVVGKGHWFLLKGTKTFTIQPDGTVKQ